MRAYLTLTVGILIGCNNNSLPVVDDTESQFAVSDMADEKAIVAFCSDCHQPPNPAYFSKTDWPKEVYRGFRFHIDAGRSQSLDSPSVDQTVEYFVTRAPDLLPEPKPIGFVPDKVARFRRSEVDVPKVTGAAVSYLSSQRSLNDTRKIFFSDMLEGSVKSWVPGSADFEIVSSTSHPAGLEWCDLDSDSLMDLVISDLGSFQPEDNEHGRILWLRQLEGGRFEESVIAEGLGRVSESRAADFNGDGLIDLVVAEFGWLKTGHILLYFQRLSPDGVRSFEKAVVDERHGTIRVPPLDLDGNGTIDFVANITQEHEAIECFLNSGDGTFQRLPLCSPKDPAYGSSGLQPVDLDNDGDMDFLVSNGDMFDSFAVKPYHGLRWLENTGNMKFEEHELLLMPGLHGIASGDLDGDGDLDVVATALFPLRSFQEMEDLGRTVTSAVWLEQTSAGKFEPHLIEQGAPWHACVLLEDIDSDNDLDVILGDFTPIETELRSPFVIYENNPSLPATKNP